ncbi:MAG: hypothetical protein IKF52_01325 [Clostridia bacterium]|nr:hypothetical protein [Clostridia bacterium]MBR3152216.1 hypothetical protein [Clostridia bacterium]MBR3152247.1 hypothetical protein [Clostridia bacterium]
MFENKKTERICSLYVNEMHLVVMLIPYIEKNLERNVKIVTILEKDLNNELDVLLERTNLNESKKKKIREINWDSKKLDEIEKLNLKNGIVIINGSREFVERVNFLIENKAEKIINCIKLEDFEKRASSVLEKHDKILNTLGEREISEVFHIDLRNNVRL